MGDSLHRGRGEFGGLDHELVKILAGAREKGRLVKVEGYNATVQNLARAKKSPICKHMDYLFPNVNFCSYMHSSHKSPKASVKKLAGLYNKEASKVESDITIQQFVCLWASSVALHTTWGADGEPLHHTPVPPEKLSHMQYKDSSPGYSDPDFGKKRTSKREEAVLVEIQIRAAERERIVPLHVLKGAKKNEAIETIGKSVAGAKPEEKNVRYFYISNTCSYGAQMANGLRQQAAEGQTLSDARVMPVVGGFYYSLIMQLTRHLEDALPFADREEYVRQTGTYNFDVKGWEYSVGPLAKVIYCLGVRATIGNPMYPYSLAGAFASFICPIVLLHGEFGIVAPNLLPSGDLFTFDCNTAHNRMITIDFAKTLPESERPILFSSVKAGDDSIQLAHKHVAGLKQHYEKWGMQIAEEGSGHFLQRFINIDKRSMDPIKERVLNKIYHSEGDMEKKAQQIYSIFQTMGSDTSYMRKLMGVVPPPRSFAQAADGDHLGVYGRALTDDIQLRVFHEPADPNFVKLCWAMEILHNNTPRHMQMIVDVDKSKEKTIKNFPHLFL